MPPAKPSSCSAQRRSSSAQRRSSCARSAAACTLSSACSLVARTLSAAACSARCVFDPATNARHCANAAALACRAQWTTLAVRHSASCRCASAPLVHSRHAAASIVGYDITVRDTLETASRWIKELQEHAPECRIVLVGNTADLEPERQVSTHEGRMLAESSGDVPFFETSAKTGLNCTEAFHAAARSALGTYRHPPRYLALLAARARLAWMRVVIAASHHGISLALGMLEPSLLHHIGRLVPDRVAHCVGLRSLGGAPGARMLQTSFAAHSFAALYLRHSITAWRM